MFGFINRMIDSCRETMKKADFSNMTAEDAFSCAVIKKRGMTEDVFNTFVADTLRAIYNEISLHDRPMLEAIIEYPQYFNPQWRTAFCDRMMSLGYQVLFSDNTVCIVSWRYRGNDVLATNEYDIRKPKKKKRKTKKREKRKEPQVLLDE